MLEQYRARLSPKGEEILMRPGGGKQKGAEFERLVCRLLSIWTTHGERADIFWRSSISGGRAPVALKKGEIAEYHTSDIAPMHELAYKLLRVFTVECKHVKDLGLGVLPYHGAHPPILHHWKQVRRDSESVNKKPMLIARQTGRPILLGVGIDVLDEFRSLHLREVRLTGFPASVLVLKENLALVGLGRFLEVVPPEDIEKIWS